MANNPLVEKILGLKQKHEALQEQLADPQVISDMKRYVQLSKDYKELSPVIKAGMAYKKVVEDIEAAKDIIANEKDEELREMAKMELSELEPRLPEMDAVVGKRAPQLLPAREQDFVSFVRAAGGIRILQHKKAFRKLSVKKGRVPDRKSVV